MSTIGIITVHKCDDCGKIAVVHTVEDEASFETNWYSGLMVDLCPDCKNLIRNQSMIVEDEAAGTGLGEAVKLSVTPTKEAQHA